MAYKYFIFVLFSLCMCAIQHLYFGTKRDAGGREALVSRSRARPLTCGRRIPNGFRQCNIGKATISSRLPGEATQLRSGNADLLFP